MKKTNKVKYGPDFENQLKDLKKAILEKDMKAHNQLLVAIEREKDNLLLNPHRGIQIEKKKIPKEYVTDYGLTNLWKIDLPGFWRMIYTITGNEIEIISILLEFMDHKTYDKKFGYRKK
ncbi:type II toxin-antitoxin system RelE/ParE family toxin [Candidatus Woesearchaeota archaeon]|nr:type II toxin-antitoxin system RelE/ParE family toxin [Candidatus Woesearchaeota archaeon]